MSWITLQQEVNTLILAAFGLDHEVVFDRQQEITIGPQDRAVLSVWPGKASAVAQDAGLCGTASMAPLMVDIYASDGERCGKAFDKLKDVLREAELSAGQVVRCDPEPLYSGKHQTDALRAVIMFQYID